MTLTEAMKHEHAFGDWRNDGRVWCAVCSQEGSAPPVVSLHTAVAELLAALLADDQKALLILLPRTKQALAQLARAYNA